MNIEIELNDKVTLTLDFEEARNLKSLCSFVTKFTHSIKLCDFAKKK
jgi:hypothetical protein